MAIFERFICPAVAIFSIFCLHAVTSVPVEYLQKREGVIQSEAAQRLGGDGSDLNADEKKVNELMLKEKKALIEAARLNGSDFPATHNFLDQQACRAMEKTRSFQIIRQMPKGAILHTHDEAMTNIDWLVKNVTYRHHCYMCVTSSFNVAFHFFDTPPTDPEGDNDNCTWTLVSEYRRQSRNVNAFDRSLFDNFTMVTPDPAKSYPDIDTVWAKFEGYFSKVEGLVLHAPVFEDYLWQGLEEIRADNVQYVEIRALLVPLYELDGTTHGSEWVLKVYKRVLENFVNAYPDFTGGRVIKSSIRVKPEKDILSEVKETITLITKYPDILVGYDLIAQEDPYHPLLYYIDALLYPQSVGVDLPYFFHAGETNWLGTATDYNLVDALLLNTTRIGHSFALIKHPALMERVKDRDIAIEVNPISNQVLKLVEDLRNHPVTSLISQNMPVVISSDDAVTWEALPLSHDFYVTFMALTGADVGLATLKQLAKNSIRYSVLPPAEKRAAMEAWQIKWDGFIQDIVTNVISQPGCL